MSRIPTASRQPSKILAIHPQICPKEADVIVLNTCVVRESAEQKAIGRLTILEKTERLRIRIWCSA